MFLNFIIMTLSKKAINWYTDTTSSSTALVPTGMIIPKD
jgi:hypothetical protein